MISYMISLAYSARFQMAGSASQRHSHRPGHPPRLRHRGRGSDGPTRSARLSDSTRTRRLGDPDSLLPGRPCDSESDSGPGTESVCQFRITLTACHWQWFLAGPVKVGPAAFVPTQFRVVGENAQRRKPPCCCRIFLNGILVLFLTLPLPQKQEERCFQIGSIFLKSFMEIINAFTLHLYYIIMGIINNPVDITSGK
jgi:hypothetical protein